MAIRIAAASSDGKVINQHFGATPQFVIFDVDEHGITFVENRRNEPPCHQGEHSDDLLLNAVMGLKDCRLVLVSKAGPVAKSYLGLQGIDVIECASFIEEAVSRLQNSNYF